MNEEPNTSTSSQSAKDDATNFFYASEDAHLYDATVRLTDRAYDLVHECLTDTLGAWIATYETQSLQKGGLIVDVGCGTGNEAMRMLKLFPEHRLLCIDLSAEMLREFARKVSDAYGNDSADDRLQYFQADVRHEGWLSEALSRVDWQLPCIAVVSVYTLHHFTPKEKFAIYGEIARCLTASGIFINADLFSFDLPWLATFAQEREIDWVMDQFTNPSADFAHVVAGLGKMRERLRDEWVNHLKLANRPLPIAKATHLSDDESEMALLQRTSFLRCECLFRYYQSGILLASK